MRTFKIHRNTPGLVLIQETGTDIKIDNHFARKDLEFTDEHVLVDPAKVKAFGNAVYESGSHAARLAKDGYFVFSQVAGQESKYMFAVREQDINIAQ